jgi:WD40 repeat protein
LTDPRSEDRLAAGLGRRWREPGRDAPLDFSNLIRKVAFRPDGRTILTVGSDPAVRLWDAATGQQIGESFEHPHHVGWVAFSPDGRRTVKRAGSALDGSDAPGGELVV